MSKPKPYNNEQYLIERAAHPERYHAFKLAAVEVLESGKTRYSAKGIAEIVRQHRRNNGKPITINNNSVPFMARELADTDSRFANFFKLAPKREPSVLVPVERYNQLLAREKAFLSAAK